MTSIVVRQDGGEWFEPAITGYALESELQEILAAYPELIPGVSSAAKVCREFQSEVGPADIVVVDSGGEITLVECKLASNPQIRREIVGQMFDYASRLWKMDVDDFARRWNLRTSKSLWEENIDSESVLRESLALNLRAGNFRIVLAVDAINPQLKCMVEYLNMMAGAGTSIVAVEYTRRRQGNLEVLMPQAFGEELANAKTRPETSPTTHWDVESIRAWIAQQDRPSLEAFNELIKSTKSAGFEFSGSTSINPAGTIPICSQLGAQFGTVSIFYFRGQGMSLEFNFKRLSQMPIDSLPQSAARELFLDELNSIADLEEVGMSLRNSRFASRKPNVPLSGLSEESVQRAFTALSVLADIRK